MTKQTNKKQLLNDLLLYGNDKHEYTGKVASTTTQMEFDDLVDINYKKCFACEYINSDSIRENETFLKMMKLYTQNASEITKDAIFELIKEYFDEEVKPLFAQQNIQVDWTLECIKEHFLTHTQYPSDEILTQLRLKRALRTHLSNNMVEKNVDGRMTFNTENIKLMTILDKEILALMRSKRDIPSMVGYSDVLDF